MKAFILPLVIALLVPSLQAYDAPEILREVKDGPTVAAYENLLAGTVADSEWGILIRKGFVLTQAEIKAHPWYATFLAAEMQEVKKTYLQTKILRTPDRERIVRAMRAALRNDSPKGLEAEYEKLNREVEREKDRRQARR